ncbi:MAG: leucine-rich repeat protein [Faecousia sp.]
MKQHVLSVLLLLSLLLSILPLGVQAEENGFIDSITAVSEDIDRESLETLSDLEAPNGYTFDGSVSRQSYPKRTATEGSCGETLTWSFSDGELVISGTGAMTEFAGLSDAPWYDLAASVKKVTICSGATSISQFAFCNLSSLSEISIPDTVTAIGQMAFIRCTSLTAAVLPASVGEIPYGLFGDCSAFVSITAPGVTTIGDYAFQGTSITSFEVWKQLTDISSLAFFKTPIEAFTVEDGNPIYTASAGVLYTDAGKTLFAYPQGASADSFTMPATVTKVGDLAFANAASLKQIKLPSSVETLGSSAFQDAGLTSVTIPNSVTEAGDFTFYGASLQSVTFGTGLESTSYEMFEGCTSLTEIHFPSTPFRLYARTFAYCSSLTEVTLPQNVEEIGNGCFGECRRLRSFTGEGLKLIPFQALMNCSALEEVTLPVVEDIKRASFYGCSSLKQVLLPATTTYVHNVAFPADTLLLCANPELSKFGTNGLARIQDINITGTDSYTESYRVLELVNEERGKQGLAPLQMDQTLIDCAMKRAAEISILFSHTRPDGACIFEMDPKIYAENIAAGQSSAEQVMNSWMNSEGHKANILTSNFRSIGIGCFRIGNVYYWVQNFGVEEADVAEKLADKTVTETISAGLYEIPEATISAGVSFAFGGSNAPYTINFTVKLTSNPILKGETAQATVVASNSGFYVPITIENTGCEWSSSDETVAAVNESGVITAIGDGAADICVKLGLIEQQTRITVGQEASNPEPTDPKPDDPEPTEPKPDDPEPTDPEPTDPEPTNPEPTDPETSATCNGGEDCPSKKFVDVNTKEWYHPYVDYAVTHGLFGGTSGNTFEPETAMTRAMLVTVLWRYEGQPKGYQNTFSDVNAKSGSWYIDAVAWASANGVVNGVGNGKFDPEGKITREQMAAILFRYAQKKGIDTSKRGDLSGFPDANRISGYAKEAVYWTVGEGIINGSDGKLLPQGNATRAQVATILMRYIENIVKK